MGKSKAEREEAAEGEMNLRGGERKKKRVGRKVGGRGRGVGMLREVDWKGKGRSGKEEEDERESS